MGVHVVGVDGGTTKTIALVADEQGQIVGVARGAGSNWTGPDVEKPMQVVVATVSQALSGAGLRPTDIAMAAFGLAGADWPEDYARRQAFLEKRGIARRILVKNDVMVGWRAGTHQHYGVAIVAGTGTNTAIVAPDGREYCYGYYALYGGAKDIAREALHAVLREEDGRGARTALTPGILGKLGYSNAEMLLRAMTGDGLSPGAQLALCPLVFEAAAAGDEVAVEIIVKQGLALSEYATAGIKRFHMEGLAFDVVLAGSVFKGQGPLLIDTITQAVHRVAPHARVVQAAFEPAVGGLLLAYDALGLPVSEAMYVNLARTVPGPAYFDTVHSAPTVTRPREDRT